MSYDYLLFDNQTLGPTGHTDFSVKGATGCLKNHSKAKSKFGEYGWHSIGGGLEALKGFESALGGIRLSDGYLLCVSIETQDRAGRDSYAIVGMFCSGKADLLELLTAGNPIRMARAVYRGSPPDGLQLSGNRITLSTQPALPNGLHTFTRASTADVLTLLVEGMNSGYLPSVRGIAPYAVNAEKLLNGFEHAFCPGLPKNIEARRKETVVEWQAPSKSRPTWMVWTIPVAAVIAIVWLVLLLKPASDATVTPQFQRDENIHDASPIPATPHPTEGGRPPHENTQAFLAEFQTTLKQLRNFPPAELEKTQEFAILTNTAIRLTPAYEAPRQAMIHLVEVDLPAFQERVFNKNLEHYYEQETNGLTAEQRESEILKRVADLNAPKKDCDLIRASFQTWTSSSGPTHDWCGVVDTFAALAASSSPRR